MDMREFEKRLNEIRAKNGWRIDIECCGVFIVTIKDKETGKGLYRTGCTSLACLPDIMDEKTLKSGIWENLSGRYNG